MAPFVLANRGAAEAGPVFRELLRSDDIELKRAAIICLGIVKDPESRNAIEDQARRGHPRVGGDRSQVLYWNAALALSQLS